MIFSKKKRNRIIIQADTHDHLRETDKKNQKIISMIIQRVAKDQEVGNIYVHRLNHLFETRHLDHHQDIRTREAIVVGTTILPRIGGH